MKNHEARWVILLLALNLVLGSLFCFVVFPWLAGRFSVPLDPDSFGKLGANLYQGLGFVFQSDQPPTIYKAPLYPALIWLLYALTGGVNVWAVQAVQCLLLTATCGLFYLLARHVFDRRIALWGLTACAVYPTLLWYVPRIWLETFLTFLLTTTMLVVAWTLARPAWWRAALCGLLVGLLALTKGVMLAFPLALAPAFLYKLRGRGLLYLAILVAASVLVIAPWTARNYLVAGGLVPIQTSGGYNYLLGDGFVHHFGENPWSYTYLIQKAHPETLAILIEARGTADLSELEQEHVLMAAAIQRVLTDPLSLARKVVIQAGTFWYLAADLPKSLLTGMVQVPTMLLAIVGSAFVLRRRAAGVLFLLPILYLWGTSVVIFAFGRLSAPIMPYVIVLAIYGLLASRTKIVHLVRPRGGIQQHD